MCVSIVLCIFCVLFPHLFHFIVVQYFFLITGIREKGTSQENRVLSSSGRNCGRWKF
jgi:hypothetical protein